MIKLTGSIFLLQIVFISHVFAQKIEVRHGYAWLGGGENPVSIIEIENASIKDIEKKWTSYIKEHKGKITRQGDTWFHDNAVVKSIGKDTLDMWSTVKESGKSVVVTLAVNNGGNFIGNSGGHQKAVDRFLKDFATETHKDLIGVEIAAAKKLRSVKEKELSQLEKENKKLEKEIEEMKSKIGDNERTIKQNKELQDSHQKELNSHDSNVKELEKRVKNLD